MAHPACAAATHLASCSKIWQSRAVYSYSCRPCTDLRGHVKAVNNETSCKRGEAGGLSQSTSVGSTYLLVPLGDEIQVGWALMCRWQSGQHQHPASKSASGPQFTLLPKMVLC